MRIAELSRRAGVPIPTIKYYLREGLLQQGQLTSPNQARYDERHVERLRLVRALIDLGRLPIGVIRDLIAEIDRPHPDLHRALGHALTSNPHPRARGDDAALEAAERETEGLITGRGWRVHEKAPARRSVAESIVALRQLGVTELDTLIRVYAEAAERVARAELAVVAKLDDPQAVVYQSVLYTVIGEALITGLRRLAQEAASAATFVDPEETRRAGKRPA